MAKSKDDCDELPDEAQESSKKFEAQASELANGRESEVMEG